MLDLLTSPEAFTVYGILASVYAAWESRRLRTVLSDLLSKGKNS